MSDVIDKLRAAQERCENIDKCDTVSAQVFNEDTGQCEDPCDIDFSSTIARLEELRIRGLELGAEIIRLGQPCRDCHAAPPNCGRGTSCCRDICDATVAAIAPLLREADAILEEQEEIPSRLFDCSGTSFP